MSSAGAVADVVEHVVLFKVRDDVEASKVDAMLSGLGALVSLDVVAHLVACPVLRHRSAAASAAGFTHLLHSRYRSKSDLSAYAAHPSHVAVVRDLVRPICDDIMAADWIAEVDGPVAPPAGSALRLTLARPRDEGDAKGALLASLAEAKAAAKSPGGAQGVSYGENFSLARAKGYSVGMLTVFRGLEELEAMEGATLEAVEEKVRPLLDSVIVLDFVVQPQHAVAKL